MPEGEGTCKQGEAPGRPPCLPTEQQPVATSHLHPSAPLTLGCRAGDARVQFTELETPDCSPRSPYQHDDCWVNAWEQGRPALTRAPAWTCTLYQVTSTKPICQADRCGCLAGLPPLRGSHFQWRAQHEITHAGSHRLSDTVCRPCTADCVPSTYKPI